jgi:hypothetical protein
MLLNRQLAVLEEDEGLTLTPFERNLEVWRQLWRVLERSDIVVQVRNTSLTYVASCLVVCMGGCQGGDLVDSFLTLIHKVG